MKKLDTLLIKRFLYNSNDVEKKAFNINIVFSSAYFNDAKEWLIEHQNEGNYMIIFNEQNNKHNVVEIPEFTDSELAYLNSYISNCSILDLSEKVTQIHKWIKFWGILTIICVIIAIIGLLASI